MEDAAVGPVHFVHETEGQELVNELMDRRVVRWTRHGSWERGMLTAVLQRRSLGSRQRSRITWQKEDTEKHRKSVGHHAQPSIRT